MGTAPGKGRDLCPGTSFSGLSRGDRGRRGVPGAEPAPELPGQALARGAFAPGQLTQPLPERDRGTLKALHPSTHLAPQNRASQATQAL